MPPIHRFDGMPTGAVMGFCNMLNKLTLDAMIKGKTPRLVLVFDAKGKTFRHDIYKEYKGNRPAAPIDLIPQFSLVRQAAKAYGIVQVEADSYEADDVIATLAQMALAEGIDVNIFSADKDLMQLVTDKGMVPSVHMIDPASMSRVTFDQVMTKFGVPPTLLGDVLALAGDSADNIPGVPGIGPKIAAQLMQDFGSLDNLLENTDKVKQKARRAKLEQFADQARLSRVLVELERNVPMHKLTLPGGFQVSELQMELMDADRIVAFYDSMGFQDIKRRFQNSMSEKPKQVKKPFFNRRTKASIPKPEDYSDVPF
jgi:DNA polymerase-1